MPSRYEGLALLPIEAALSNLPVIATDAPGLREGFPKDYPWLAAPGDAASFAKLLQRALDEPEKLPAAARAAHEFARKYFDLTVMCNAYRALYQQAQQ